METFGEMWALPVLGGFIALGIAMALGMAWTSRRDKRKDAMTEEATHALYDSAERAGGDDVISRSPEDRPQDVRDGERLPDYARPPRA